ncbi:hypothetical protein TWF281_003845 [Arthrobotrys megalospora]
MEAISVLGARLFCSRSELKKVAWLINYGTDIPHAAHETVKAWNVSILKTAKPPAPTATSFLRYQNLHTEREFCFLQKPVEVEPDDIRIGTAATSKSFHLHCLPEDVTHFVAAIHSARKDLGILDPPLIIWEPSPPSCIESNREAILQAIKEVNVFSPNHEELGRILGRDDAIRLEPSDIMTLAEEIAYRVSTWANKKPHTCIVVRSGRLGCYIRSSMQSSWLSPYWTPSSARVIDPTGAGNAFLGSFAIGYLRTANWIEAGKYGNIGASFVVEQNGTPPLTEGERWNGETVESRLRHYNVGLEENGRE